MNLWKLFNLNRFKGCDNPRTRFSYIKRDESKALSVECVLLDGTPQLQLRRKNEPPCHRNQLELPSYIYERMDFWERWVKTALLNKDECYFSVYGMEVYGMSIALDIAAIHPDWSIDYCGLAVHDDFSIYQYMCQDHSDGYNLSNRERMLLDGYSGVKTSSGHRLPSLSDGMRPLDEKETMNYHMKTLLAGENTDCSNERELNVRFFSADVDYGYCNMYLSAPGEKYKWGGSVESCYIEIPEFPQWLVALFDKIGHLRHDDQFWSCNSWETENPIWFPSPMLHPLWCDSIAIDIARYISPPCFISFRKEYTTGMDIHLLREYS